MPIQGRPGPLRLRSARHGPPLRRRTLDSFRRLNEMQEAELGDPETTTRIAQYELAFRMQASVPE
jgi:hypothetical protein